MEDMEATTSAVSMSSAEDSGPSSQWSLSQLVWAKSARSPWWPAQVLDEATANEVVRAQRGSGEQVLVRYFGNDKYKWVNPASDLSTFDTDFEQRSVSEVKVLQKALREALAYRDSGTLPARWIPKEARTHASKKQKASSEDSENGTGEAKQPKRATSTRKRKPKVLYEDEERLHQTSKNSGTSRRVRIMRELGLCAPSGSPYARVKRCNYCERTRVLI